jgi:hypothetical protein
LAVDRGPTASARQTVARRGWAEADLRWRRVGSVLHATIVVGVIGLFALIALFFAVLVVVGPIGNP